MMFLYLITINTSHARSIGNVFVLLRVILFLFVASICKQHLQGQTPATSIVKVARVIDGDTFDVIQNDSTIRIRMQGIDAPEPGQEFYAESKQLLTELTSNQQIIIERKGMDRYGRCLATIVRANDHLNVNYEMVRKGMAWHYAKYSTDHNLAKLESEARKKELGLWSLYHYTAPWEFRSGN